MAQRYFVEQLIVSEEVRLVGPEAHHLRHVMRCRKGDQVVLFDGSGKEYLAEVCAFARDGITLTVKSSSICDLELPGQLVVAAALPKGDRQRVLVEKLVELGTTTLVPLITTRGIAQNSDHTIPRLVRYAIEASKQCGRNRLMQVGPAANCEAYFISDSCSTRLIAHPTGAPLSAVSWTSAIAVAIGPEGGFTEDEIHLALEQRWQPVCLGPRILRVETAAIFLAAIAAAHLGGQKPPIS